MKAQRHIASIIGARQKASAEHGNVYKVAAEIFVVNINFNLTFLAGETENFEWR